MGKAYLVNIDLMVRVVVPDNATEVEIRYAAAQKAQNEACARSGQGLGWLNEGAAEIREDTEIPYDPDTESEDGRALIGYQIESTDGNHDIPEGLYSFEIFETRKAADKWLDENNPAGSWRIITIFDGDVEGVTYVDQPITE